ncbi:hypothetical protein [Variovorax sp. GB1P17]
MDVAFEMDDVMRTAMCIVFSEQASESNIFDWDRMDWAARD